MEFSLVSSAAESLNMSIDEVEDKFTLSQLIIMSTIQELTSPSPGKKNILNTGMAPEEKNKYAWGKL